MTTSIEDSAGTARGESQPRAAFHSMTEGTQADWDRIVAAQLEFYPGLADRVMSHLGLLAGDYGGFVVDRLSHSTQTATRAARDNRSDDYVACALLHDIGDTLGSFNHPDVAAAIIWPFVDDDLHWMVAQHGVFQGYYFFEYLGLDPNLRDQFEGHCQYDLCAEFCAEYDQAAFDPDYPSMDLEEFRPLLEGFFARPKRSIYMRSDQGPNVAGSAASQSSTQSAGGSDNSWPGSR